jgi:hypothetical protein
MPKMTLLSFDKFGTLDRLYMTEEVFVLSKNHWKAQLHMFGRPNY